jgi:hypothetical protein
MGKVGSFNGFIKFITTFARQHSTELLVGLGISGMATTTVLAVRATPKVIKKIDAAIADANEALMDEAVAAQEENYIPITRLKRRDVVKLCWKDYAPAAVTGVASIICIIGGTRINLRRNAALVTAVKLSEATIKDLQSYKKKVIETIGEEKNDEIETKVTEETLQQAYVNMDSQIVQGTGSILCFDKIGGQWFKSDKETIRSVINTLNYRLNDEVYVPLNDLYYELKMKQTVAGRSLGWNRDQGLIDPDFSSHLMPNGVPVLVFSTRIEPRANYERLY